MNIDVYPFDPKRCTYALVTSTMYGNWLPGDERGCVLEHNEYGTPFDLPSATRKKTAQLKMKESIVSFNQEQSQLVLDTWLNNAENFKCRIIVAAIMYNHFHFVLVGSHELDKPKILRCFKGCASRALNTKYGSRSWWTDSGSVRFCFDQEAFQARINYVKNQENPLALWTAPEFAEH